MPKRDSTDPAVRSAARSAGPRPGIGTLVLAGLVAACAPASDRAAEGLSVDTIAGIRTVTNLAGAPAASRTAAVLSDTPLRIGRVEGDGPDMFGRIAAVAVGPDGRVHIADGVAFEVRVFSPDGEFLHGFGGQGEGPGEFEHIDGLVVGRDGGVWVRDSRLGRVSRFGPGGEYEDSFRLERSFLVFSDGTTFWADTAGRVYDRMIFPTPIDEPDRVGIVVYSPVSDPDTVVVVSHRPRRVFAREGGRPVVGMLAPFSPRPVIAVSPRGEIAAGLGDAYRIGVSDAAGDTLFQFGRVVASPPVAGGERDAAVERLRARAEEMAPGAVLDDVELPDTKPLISEIRADGDRGWWVGRYRGEVDPDDPTAALPTEYDVFDATGRLLGSVEIPPILLFEIGPDYVAGVETDELGVQYAVVYGLARSG